MPLPDTGFVYQFAVPFDDERVLRSGEGVPRPVPTQRHDDLVLRSMEEDAQTAQARTIKVESGWFGF